MGEDKKKQDNKKMAETNDWEEVPITDWEEVEVSDTPYINFGAMANQAKEDLPSLLGAAGGIVGGVMGAGPLSVPGALTGAAIGGYTGQAIKNVLRRIQDEPVTRQDIYLEPFTQAAWQMGTEGAGIGTGKVVGKGIEKAGEIIYKATLPKNLPKVVKDALYKAKVSGDTSELKKVVDEMKDFYNQEIESAVKKATAKGSRVSMEAAFDSTIKLIQELAEKDRPETRELISSLKKQINPYLIKEGKFINRSNKLTKFSPENLVQEYTPMQIKEAPIGLTEAEAKKLGFTYSGETGLPIQGEMIPDYTKVSFKKRKVSLPMQGEEIPGYTEVSFPKRQVSLPVQGETIPGYTEVSFPKREVSLPVQGETIPGYTEVSFPKREVSLPIQGETIPGYTEVSFPKKEISLPIQGQYGPIRQVPELLATKEGVTRSVFDLIPKTEQQFIPKENIIGSIIDVMKGKEVPEVFLQKPEVAGSVIDVIKGKDIPDVFYQKPEVAGTVIDVTKGKDIPDVFYQKPELAGTVIDVVMGKSVPPVYLQKPELPGTVIDAIKGDYVPPVYLQKPAIPAIEKIIATRSPGRGVKGKRAKTFASPTASEALQLKRDLYDLIDDPKWANKRAMSSWESALTGLSLGVKDAIEKEIIAKLGEKEGQQFILNNKAAGTFIDASKALLNKEQVPYSEMVKRGIQAGVGAGSKAAIVEPLMFFRPYMNKAAMNTAMFGERLSQAPLKTKTFFEAMRALLNMEPQTTTEKVQVENP